MNTDGLLKDLGRSYIISAFIPAALFLIVISVVLQDFISFFTPGMNIYSQIKLENWIVILVITGWCSYLLYSGIYWILAFFQGAFLPKWLSARLIKQKENNFTKLLKRNAIPYKDLQPLTEKDYQNVNIDKIIEDRQNLEARAISDFSQVTKNYPIRGAKQPTRLGNIIQATSYYCLDRYNIEYDSILPRLILISPKDFQNSFEEANYKFNFLINSSFLSLLTGFVIFIILLLRLPCYILPSFANNSVSTFYLINFCPVANVSVTFFQAGFRNTSEWGYFLFGCGLFLFGYFLYTVALSASRELLTLTRTAFDLYRLELLKAYHIPFSSELVDQDLKWNNLCNFLETGRIDFSEIIPDFSPAPYTPEKSSSSPINVSVRGHLDIPKGNKK
jgi:hypothetical protein